MLSAPPLDDLNGFHYVRSLIPYSPIAFYCDADLLGEEISGAVDFAPAVGHPDDTVEDGGAAGGAP